MDNGRCAYMLVMQWAMRAGAPQNRWRRWLRAVAAGRAGFKA